MEFGIVARTTTGYFKYAGWPTMTKDEKGVIHVVYSGHRLAHVCPFGKILLCQSRDDGKSWTLPQIAVDGPLDDRDAAILPLGEDKLFMSWVAQGPRGLEGTWRCINIDSPLAEGMIETWKSLPPEESKTKYYASISHDGGKTWEEPWTIPTLSPHGPCRTQEGKLFLAGYNQTQKDGSISYNLLIHAYESEDEGRTWKKISTLPYVEEYMGEAATQNCEPYAIALPDGSILVAVRGHTGKTRDKVRTYLCRSRDGGKTWDGPRYMDHVGAPPHLMLHSSGALVMTYNKRIDPIGEYARVSFDLGESWTEEALISPISPDWDLGYPTSVELETGEILTVYYQKYEKDPYCSVLSTRWRLEEIVKK